MTQDSSSPRPTVVDELDLAKAVVGSLRGHDKAIQARAIRFATETLGLDALIPRLGGITSVGAGRESDQSAMVPTAAVSSRRGDIKQFAQDKRPSSDVEFAVVVAYYFAFEADEAKRKESIGPNDLIEAARHVGRARPQRARGPLNRAKNAGYLDSVGAGVFKINNVGENLVAVTLPRSGSEPAIGPRRLSKAIRGSARTAPGASPKRRKA
jgi:hypothetical protein